MQQGTIKWFNQDRGFGFVTTDEGDDLFVHCSDIANYRAGCLIEGDRIEFDVTQSHKGSRAVSARLL